ncbi:MAG: PorP/SprF family type IX secretion system membrane protein, partial [Bacteroidia bacterium]
MKKLKFTIILLQLAIMTFLSKTAFSQDPTFAQSFSSSQYLNPALTGFTGFTRIQASHRLQWMNTPSAFITSYLGADLSSKNNKWGFGVYAINDIASNTLYTLSINLNVAYRIRFTENSALRFGIGFGSIRRSIKVENLTFGDQIDSRYGFIYDTSQQPPASTSINFINFNAGMFFHNKYLFAGYSIHNFNEPDQGFFAHTAALPIRHSFQLGVSTYTSDNTNLTVKPSVIYMRQQDFNNLLFGVTSQYKSIGMGLF